MKQLILGEIRCENGENFRENNKCRLSHVTFRFSSADTYRQNCVRICFLWATKLPSPKVHCNYRVDMKMFVFVKIASRKYTKICANLGRNFRNNLGTFSQKMNKCLLSYKKAKLISIIWNQGTVYVKIIWGTCDLGRFSRKYFVFLKIWSEICVSKEQMCHVAWKICGFAKVVFFAKTERFWWFLQKWKCLDDFRRNEKRAFLFQP